MEHKGKMLPENRKLSVQYGRAKSTMRMCDVSNKPFDSVSCDRQLLSSIGGLIPSIDGDLPMVVYDERG